MLFVAINSFRFRHLEVRLGSSSVYHKTNRETVAEIHESVRGKDVYIIQTGTRYLNWCFPMDNPIRDKLLDFSKMKIQKLNHVVSKRLILWT